MADEYNHTQGSASATWDISHGILANTYACDVMIYSGGQLKKVLPVSVKDMGGSVLRVTFSEPQTGKVRIIGKTE